MNKEEIIKKIETNKDFTCQCLLALYYRRLERNKQKANGEVPTIHAYSRFDIEFFNSLAEQFQKLHRLTDKQLMELRKRLIHYWKRINEMINNKELPVVSFDNYENHNRVIVTVKDGYIYIKFHYDNFLIEKIKQIPNAIYKSAIKSWIIPKLFVSEVSEFLMEINLGEFKYSIECSFDYVKYLEAV